MAFEDRPPTISHPRLFLRFLRFGLQAFGGPVAQIDMIRRALVEEDRWLSRERFNRLLAVMQALPGPEAHELCVHMGIRAGGRLGGLLAGLGFMLPGLVLMLAAGWAYAAFAPSHDLLAGAFLGMQTAVLALILRAVHGIGRQVLESRLLWLLAAAALTATLAGVSFWVVLGGAGAVHALAGMGRPGAAVVAVLATVLAALLLHTTGGPLPAHPLADVGTAGVAALFWAGLKGGMLTFGGAYTAIPYMRADTVGRGWITDGAFLDGVALAGILPTPLIMFGTFVGYVVGGFTGALAVSAGLFLPAFGFSLVFYERLESLVENRTLHALLEGVAAATVGVIVATALQLGSGAAARVPDLWPAVAIFTVTLGVVWVWKSRFAAPLLILAAGAAGWAAFA